MRGSAADVFARRALVRFLLGAAAALMTAKAYASGPASRPNLIFIVFDTLRAQELGCYGYERPTSPNLDAMARNGTLFENHFAQALFTFPSVPSYFTGKYFPVDCLADPHTGVEELQPPPREKMLTEILKEAGYRSAIVTPHIGYFSPECRLSKSFDTYIPVYAPKGSPRGKGVFEDVAKAAKTWLESTPDRPFFLYVHLIDTHFPHVLAPPYTQWIRKNLSSPQIANGQPTDKEDSRFSMEEREHLRGLYDGSILEADHELGEFLAYIHGRGLSDNTIVAIGSDHGETLGEDGTTWGHFSVDYDEILRVPFIVSGPNVAKNKRVTQLTENVDIVPTLLELLSVKTDVECDGVSLVPAMRSDAAGPNRQFVVAKNPMTHKGRKFPQPPIYIVRTKTHKYEFDAMTGSEAVYSVPDPCGGRHELGTSIDAIADLRQLVKSKVQPRWQAYASLPTLRIEFPLEDRVLETAEPKGSIVPFDDKRSDELHRDNKWQSRGGMVWSCAWNEDAPAIAIRLPLRSGEYEVYLDVYSKRDHFGHPATSISFGVSGDKPVILTDDSSGTNSDKVWTTIGAGGYTVRDGVFAATIDDVQDGHWCYLRKITFVPITGQSADAEENAERLDALRTLGYIK